MRPLLITVALAVVTGIIVDLLTGWLRRSGRWLRRRAGKAVPWGSAWRAQDHSTINSGWIRVDGGMWPHVHVHLRCAPSARWDGPRRMNRNGVYRFVHRVCPGVFPHEADYAVPDELIRFMTATPDGHQLDTAVACTTAQGVVEVGVPIDHRRTDDGAVLPAVAIAGLIRRFHREVATGAYDRIFSTRPRRVDWFLNVSPQVTADGGMSVPWVGIDFPGRRPGGRAHGMSPSADARGYGREAVRSVPVGFDIDQLLRVLLTDFLERNGFHEVDGAVEDVISAAASTDAASQSAVS